MLSLHSMPSLLILAKVVLCQSGKGQNGEVNHIDSTDHYSLNRADGQRNYEVWLNRHYLDADGRSEDFPIADVPLIVTVKYKSKFDNFRYRITCPNKWYWPQDAPDGSGSFYVSTAIVGNIGEQYVDIIDPSSVCFYESYIHGDKLVEASDPSDPNKKLKKMCCLDRPLESVPGPGLEARKLPPDSVIGPYFDEPAWEEPVKNNNLHSSSDEFNSEFNPEKTAMVPNTAPETETGIDTSTQATPGTVSETEELGSSPQNQATAVDYNELSDLNYDRKLKTRGMKRTNKRKLDNRFQKNRIITG